MGFSPWGFSRRGFLKASAASLAVVGVAGRMYAAGSDTIRVGIIGCGGQGTRDLVSCVKSAPGVQIAAMGDLFADRLQESLQKLKTDVPDAVKVTPDKCFVGWDACRKVLATDVHAVLLTTPPHFRAMYLQAAIDAGKHVFMEKPAGVDPKQIRSIIKTAELAQQKKLSIVAGTQRRHSKKYQETIKRIHDGQIGQIVAAQAYWNGGDMLGYWTWWDKKNLSDVEWQLRSWPWFTWTSGDRSEEHTSELQSLRY
jgi:predicted dehydrogenase